jgi:4-amino-4-deoxy-L-arabinose transferase-like glycosyltransferase
LYALWEEHSTGAEWGAGALCAAILYLRPETVLFVAAVLAVLFLGSRGRAAVRVGAVVVLLLLPWQIRNAVVFHRWIPFTTSTGLNFFRGHNDVELGSFGDEVINQGLFDMPSGRDFEPELSRLFFRRAFGYINAAPVREFSRSASKILQLWFRDTGDPRSGNLLYIGPWLVMLAAAVLGMAVGPTWRQHKILALYLVCSTVMAVLFFVLPRYQTMMKEALLPFAGLGLVWLWDVLRRNRGKSGDVQLRG